MNAPESTLFNAVPVVSELNRVAGFDPLKFLKKTARGHELELRYKKLWFRLKYPAGRTRLTPLRITDQLAIIEARVFFDKDDADPASSYIATTTQENAPAGLYIQAAEHDALDMALTNAGFGIQFAPMPKADTPYAEPDAPVMEAVSAPAPQAAAEQVKRDLLRYRLTLSLWRCSSLNWKWFTTKKPYLTRRRWKFLRNSLRRLLRSLR